MSVMKLFKLWVHQHTFSEDELIINPKEFPEGRVGDVLEIFHPEDQGNRRLLLQINSIRSDFQQKDTISIEQSVANLFQLRTYSDVNVKKVDHNDVEVDLVEVLIKDQYVSRNDMWRLSKALVDKCVYVSKKVSFSGIRVQIHELWKKGVKKKCGVISNNTRVVFRSLTAAVYVFIQMSQEMWDFDLNGDLYFEKVINGFLYELFTKWKDAKANHEVTIVLFSRTFYDAKSEDDFPIDKRGYILQDPYGRFYEDFYQILVNEDRRDDWLPVLVTLKYHFNQYPKYINCSEDVTDMPTGNNSVAFEGNFLQAVNLTMNIFEKHHLDRNFDCTGQTIVLVTPGAGVFEVDRALNSITKQRMIDSGVAADLVCMAEQPLHSVPLLKLYNKDAGKGVSLGDDYNIPHWMNHSYYASPKSMNKHNHFLPRIQLPDVVLNQFGLPHEDNPHTKGLHRNFHPKNAKVQQDNQIPDLINYEEYDAKIFRTNTTRPRTALVNRIFSRHSASELEKPARSRDDLILREQSPQEGITHGAISIPSPSKSANRYSLPEQRKHISSSMDHTIYAQLSKDYSSRSEESGDEFFVQSPKLVVGSAGAPQKFSGFRSKFGHDHRHTLFNPFKPLNIPCRWTCNRHRWAHSFPLGPGGEVLHRHFEKRTKIDETSPQKSNGAVETELSRSKLDKTDAQEHKLSQSSESEDRSSLSDSLNELESTPRGLHELPRTPERASTVRRRAQARPNLFFHLSEEVEQDWTAAVKTSVDWKSLVLPACLPLTSEYCPNKKTLDSDYLEFHYELCIGDDDEYAVARSRSASNPNRVEDQSRHPVSVESMILELVAQRLSKGFQILTNPPKLDCGKSFQSFLGQDDEFESQEFFLSLGRNIHRLSGISKRSQINVTRYRPRHVRGTIPIQYRYRLWVDRAKQYHDKEVEFQHDELDKYNWNYLDQHISGEKDFTELVESLRYWKARFLLLPTSNRKKSANDDKEDDKVSSEEDARIEGILKYFEVLNGIKRSKARRRPLSPKPVKPTKDRPPPAEPKREKQQSTVTENPAPKEERSLGSTSSEKEVTENPKVSLSENSSIDATGSMAAERSEEDVLTSSSPLESIAEKMLETSTGLSFLPSSKGLRARSFLTIEALWWMMHNIKGLSDKKDAMSLARKMVDAKIIQHASGSARIKFIIGFAIFCVTPKDKWNEKEDLTDKKRSLRMYSSLIFDQQLQEFQERWFEATISAPKSPSVPVYLASDLAIQKYCEESSQPPAVRRGRAKSTTQNPLHDDCDCGPAYKTVNLDCDLQRKSERPEWAVIRYHGNYCSTHAFEIEVHWIETTGSVVSDLVQGWARKASSCGFHLVPVPVSPFPDPLGNNDDPLRLPVFITVAMATCQDQEENNIFQEFEPSTQRLRRFLFLESILEHFGFLKDSPYGPSHGNHSFMTPPVQCRADDYVHTSGAAFVRICDKENSAKPGEKSQEQSTGFYWMNNFMLTKRWRSASTGDVEFARKLMTDFESFCSNRTGALKAFWDSAKESLVRSRMSLDISETEYRELDTSDAPFLNETDKNEEESLLEIDRKREN